ncbi:hypothetical protein LUZ63_004127 [Rhynchospora breviuscula]|uniref:RING-type domain-containing protein n=1 Tax=Rhynchospora breviuscula TaxID=2022672 RepID=A0A9Q0D1Z3_9POAL|nr:hypothetical protein LUZ63_004127 [Rhynchospora breviuscula]
MKRGRDTEREGVVDYPDCLPCLVNSPIDCNCDCKSLRKSKHSKMLGGESPNSLFQTPLDLNLYQLFDFNDNASLWSHKQQGISHEPDNSDLCSLSLGIPGSHWLNCSLKLDYLKWEHNSNPACVSTSLSLSLPEDNHDHCYGTASTRWEMFSVYNDLRDEITRQEEEELYRELQKIREPQAISLANSIGELCKRKIIQKNRELEEMHAKNRELMERVNAEACETARWQFRAWQSQIEVRALQAQLEGPREERGENENDAASCVGDGVEGDMVARCRICKTEEAKILHLPCRHLSVCRRCDQSIDACPICLSSKAQSIEAILP